MRNTEQQQAPTTTVVTRLPVEEAARLAKLASDNHRTVAAETRRALRRYMAESEASAAA